MRVRAAMMQPCPNCQKAHDISVYVSGQKITCSCGIRFEVQRTDVSQVPRATAGASVAKTPVVTDAQFGGEALLPTLAPGSRPAEPGDEGPEEPTGPSNLMAPTIPGFDLLEVLGRGGMGEVWRARQTSLKRTVALKLLPPKLAGDREFVARFEKEATALAALSHPNIIQIIDRGVAGKHYFIVMEFVPGRSLRELMTKGRPSPQAALKIAVQIARALDHAHEEQIVHRDLKPENILVDEKGHVKVADFGLAGMQGPGSGYNLTATSVAMGTVNYMAPEQRRDAKRVDHRADLYSFGVVLYELLTGDLPVGRFKLPSQKVNGLDVKLDGLIEALLQPEPEARPSRASEVVAVLEPLVSSVPRADPQPDTLSERPSATVLTRPVSVLEKSWSGFKVALMLVGGLALLATVVKMLPASGPEPVTRTAPAWYADTEDALYARVDDKEGLTFHFDADGPEELNTHAGTWKVEGGALSAVQWGNAVGETDHPRLVPRAYVAHRYFSSDEMKIEASVAMAALGPDFPPLAADAQRYAEVGFRIKDLQVSVFAIPDTGMRLMWRYFSGGKEITGNSAADLENMVEDEAPVPASGKFKVALDLKRAEGGAVDVTARVNGQVIAHKMLPGLAGRVGKVALGCRNLTCRFDDLVLKGKEVARPAAAKD